MKRIIKLTIFLLFIFNINSFCQVSKFSILVNYDFMHYTPLKHNVFKVYNDYKYKFPISSGAEATLMYRLDKSISVGTGILFQQNRYSDFYSHWTDWAELSIPLKVRLSMNLNKRFNSFLSSGVYFNSLLYSISYYPHHLGEDGKNVYGSFSETYKILEIVLFDLFIESGIEYKIFNNLSLSISPICKYRIPKTGLSPFIYGIRFGVVYKI